MVSGRANSRGLSQSLSILLRGRFALMLPVAVILTAVASLLGRAISPAVGTSSPRAGTCDPFHFGLVAGASCFLHACVTQAGQRQEEAVLLLFLPACVYALRAIEQLSPMTAGFLGIGLGSLVVSLLLLIPLKAAGSTPGKPVRFDDNQDHRRYGSSAMATAGVAWFPTNIYFVLLPAWVGLEQAGALKALINLAMPVLLGISGLSLLFLPVLSMEHEEGAWKRMNGTLWLSFGLFFVASGLYLSLLCGFRGVVFQLLYGGKYSEFAGWPLVVVGLWPFGQAITAILGNGLRALQHPGLCFLGVFSR